MVSRLSRRRIRAPSVLALLGASAQAGAEVGYPRRPVTVVVGYAAAGATDTITRSISCELRCAGGPTCMS